MGDILHLKSIETHKIKLKQILSDLSNSSTNTHIKPNSIMSSKIIISPQIDFMAKACIMAVSDFFSAKYRFRSHDDIEETKSSLTYDIEEGIPSEVSCVQFEVSNRALGILVDV